MNMIPKVNVTTHAAIPKSHAVANIRDQVTRHKTNAPWTISGEHNSETDHSSRHYVCYQSSAGIDIHPKNGPRQEKRPARREKKNKNPMPRGICPCVKTLFVKKGSKEKGRACFANAARRIRDEKRRKGYSYGRSEHTASSQ